MFRAALISRTRVANGALRACTSSPMPAQSASGLMLRRGTYVCGTFWAHAPAESGAPTSYLLISRCKGILRAHIYAIRP